MLRLVVLGRTLSLVLGVLSGGLLVAVLQIGVDILGDAIDPVFDRRETLDPKFKAES